jgi:hypothetical protein
MVLRKGHGKGAGVPRIEVPPVDELPEGVPAPEQPPPLAPTGPERDAAGHFLPGARSAQSRGGRALAGLSKLARTIGATDAETSAAFKPYQRLAVAFRKSHVQSLAQTVGGGLCGAAPASMVESAALQLAASRFLFDTADGDSKKLKLASQLANDSRQNLLAAYELCAKEALARAKRAPASHTSLLEASFGLRGAQ